MEKYLPYALNSWLEDTNSRCTGLQWASEAKRGLGFWQAPEKPIYVGLSWQMKLAPYLLQP